MNIYNDVCSRYMNTTLNTICTISIYTTIYYLCTIYFNYHNVSGQGLCKKI